MSPYIGYTFPDFYKTIKKVINEVDIVQVEQPYLLIPTLMVVKVLNRDIPIVLDEHNVDFMSVKSKINGASFASMLTSATLPYVFLSERIAVKRAGLVLCVSQADKELLTKFYEISKDKIFVVPNGVDVSKFDDASPINNPIVNENNIVFFHGTLSWYPNLEAANIIVDYLAPKIPEAMFLIAGANAPTILIKKINKSNNVRYLGFVKNIEGWIKVSRVCIAPLLRGGGTKMKILEYAAAGKPIVATYKAVEGLGMNNKIHGLFYKNVDEYFIDGIRTLLKDIWLSKELGSNAKKYAKKYDWSLIGRCLYDIYKLLLGNHNR
ncbi:MAG: glycosyltransferase family 4 protein [Nitrososphaeria archaeon]